MLTYFYPNIYIHLLSFLSCVINFYFVSSFPGRIVSDSDHFHNKKHIWPEGYTAFRKFTSITGNLLQTCLKLFATFIIPFQDLLYLLDYALFIWYMKNLLADPNSLTSYKMEVIRNSDTKVRPLFRVTSEDGVQVSNLTFVLSMFANNFERKNMLFLNVF